MESFPDVLIQAFCSKNQCESEMKTQAREFGVYIWRATRTKGVHILSMHNVLQNQRLTNMHDTNKRILKAK